jgi:hypothetical protein
LSPEKHKYIYAPQNKWKTDDVIRSKFICNNYEIIISLKNIFKIDNTIHSVNVSVGSTGGNVVDVSLMSSEGSGLGGMEVLSGLSSSVMSFAESFRGIIVGLGSLRLFGISLRFLLLGSGFISSGFSEGSRGISDHFVVVLLGGMSSSFGSRNFFSVVFSRGILGSNSVIMGFMSINHNLVGMFPFSISLSGSSIGGIEFFMSMSFSGGSGSSGIISVLSGILGSEVFFGLLFTDLLEVLILSHVVGLVVLEFFMSISGFERGFEIHSRAIIDDGGIGGSSGSIDSNGGNDGGDINGSGGNIDGNGISCKSNSLRNGSKSSSGKYGVHFVGIVFVKLIIIN